MVSSCSNLLAKSRWIRAEWFIRFSERLYLYLTLEFFDLKTDLHSSRRLFNLQIAEPKEY